MNRPKVIINCAMSVDGKIAAPSGKQVQISSDEDMSRVYKLRHECDAVLVGINTVLQDDPKLTVKKKYVSSPKQPIRVVLDATCRTPENALVVNDKTKTFIMVNDSVSCSKSYGDHVSVVPIASRNGLLDLEFMLDYLYSQGIRLLLVEGGGTVIWNFIKQRFVDELFVYIGSMIIGGKNTPTMARGERFENGFEFIRLQLKNVQKIGDGLLLHYTLKQTKNNVE